MTTTSNTNSTVIGVFLDYDQANEAIDGLRHSQFSYDRIRLVQHGTGSFVDTLKGMFTGQASMASSTADALTKMGMPEYEAQHYQSELDANHVLLLMNADDRPEAAFDIMRQNGAFDINSRLRMDTPNGSAETLPANQSQKANNDSYRQPVSSSDRTYEMSKIATPSPTSDLNTPIEMPTNSENAAQHK